jgi:hypothetical protein
MHFTFKTHEQNGLFLTDYDYQIGRHRQQYTLQHSSKEKRSQKLNETRLLFLELNLERYMKNIEKLRQSDPLVAGHYAALTKEMDAVYSVIQSFEMNLQAAYLAARITLLGNELTKLLPPKKHKFYKQMQSFLTNLILHCEML